MILTTKFPKISFGRGEFMKFNYFALRYFLIAIFAIGLCLQFSCRLGTNGAGTTSATPVQNQLIAPDEISRQAVALAAPAQFKTTLTGAIDGKYNIQMDLERDGAKIKGTYFYKKTGAMSIAAKYISLAGTIDSDGNVDMTESAFEPQGGKEIKTGSFKGKLGAVVIGGRQSLRFVGNWTRSKDNRSMAFSLQEVKFDIGEDLRIVTRKSEDKNRSQKFDLEIELPKLEGNDPERTDKFNKTIDRLVSKEISEFKAFAVDNAKLIAKEEPSRGDMPGSSMEIGHSITASDRDFVSLLFTYYSYTGGAHPNTFTKSLNYDLRQNDPISLGSLFAPNSNYLKLISDYCLAELKKLGIGDKEWIEKGAGPKADNYKSWNIAPEGLMITFDAYQVASYAEGPQEVIVPYSILKPVIKPGGILSRFVK